MRDKERTKAWPDRFCPCCYLPWAKRDRIRYHHRTLRQRNKQRLQEECHGEV